MDKIAISLCPACSACPTVVIEEGRVRIGEAENMVVLEKAEWNVLVRSIRSEQLGEL